MARKTRRHHKSKRSRNLVKNTVNTSVNIVKSTSKKYMPKVKSGLENVGSKVIKGSKRTVPFLQRMTRKLLGAFGVKNKKR